MINYEMVPGMVISGFIAIFQLGLMINYIIWTENKRTKRWN